MSYGAVGFAVLGSFAWNYQFYGELVCELKAEAQAMKAGELKLSPTVVALLPGGSSSQNSSQADIPSASQILPENHDLQDTVEAKTDNDFHLWWATRMRPTDLWLLIITFILSAISIQSQLSRSDDFQVDTLCGRLNHLFVGACVSVVFSTPVLSSESRGSPLLVITAFLLP